MCKDGRYLGLGIDKPGERVYNVIRVFAAHDTAIESASEKANPSRGGGAKPRVLCAARIAGLPTQRGESQQVGVVF
jgi:hypothetical protein